jgi:Alginate export
MPARVPVILAALACAGSGPALAQAGEPDPVRLSVDGRIRYEVIEPAAFGFGPQDPGGYVLWRIAPQVDVDMPRGLRARVQLFAADASGREGGARANDRNDFDLTQAFVEWRPSEESFVRAGRQEIALGSGRLLAALDGANIRRRFDGLHAQWRAGNWTAVGVAASPVRVRPGTFDDDSSAGRLAVGGGVIRGDTGRNSAAGYLIRTESREGGFGAPAAPQARYTAGLRLVRTAGHAFGELELLRQWGEAEAGHEIDAWAVAGEVRATAARLKGAGLVVGTKFSLASGDADPGDRELGGFDPLFPNPGFTGSFPIFAPTNLVTVNPSVALQWDGGDRIGLDVAFLERIEAGDRAYALSGAALPAQGPDTEVGALWALTGATRLTANVSVTGSLFWLDQAGSLPAGAEDARGAFVNLNFSY